MPSMNHPKVCDLCGKDISKEDTYYAGVTRYNIFAFTCTDYDCRKWLIRWIRMSRIPGEKEGKLFTRSGGESY